MTSHGPSLPRRSPPTSSPFLPLRASDFFGLVCTWPLVECAFYVYSKTLLFCCACHGELKSRTRQAVVRDGAHRDPLFGVVALKKAAVDAPRADGTPNGTSGSSSFSTWRFLLGKQFAAQRSREGIMAPVNLSSPLLWDVGFLSYY